MNKKPLTKKQKQTLSYIKRYRFWRGYMPTIQEIADRFSLRVSSVYDRLEALEKKGMIKRCKNQPRWIEIL